MKIQKEFKGSLAYRVVKISKSELQGESTFGMKENKVEQNDLVELQVRNATKVLESLLRDSSSSFVDLFHVNCEVNVNPIHFVALALTFFDFSLHRAVNGKC